MRRSTAALGLLLAVVGLVATLPAIPAVAQEHDGGDIAVQDVTVGDGHLRFLVTGLDPDGGSAAPTGPVELRVDGYRVAAQATVPERGPEPRTTILVVDTSGSMNGALLEQAKRAVAAFLGAAPEADRVGLIAFADRPLLLAPPTAPRSTVRDAVAGLTVAGSTSLYDAVDVALTVLGTAGDQRIVVLSEGPDTASTLDLPGLLARVRAGRSRVDLVRLAPAASGAVDPQAAIADAGGGQVFHADAEGAARVLRDRALQGSSEVAVDAALPPGLSAGTVRLQLALPWGDRTVDLDTTAPLAAGTGPVGEVVEDPTASWPSLALGLAGVFAALSLVVVAVVAVPESVHGRRRVQKLVARYATVGLRAAPSGRTEGERRQDGSLREGALKLADRVAARRGIGERLALRLDRAAVAWQPNEWILLCGSLGVGAAVLASLLTGSLLVGPPAGVVAGWLGPRTFLSVRAGRRAAVFGAELPDALQLVASGLSSGYSLLQAFDSVVRLGKGPVAVEVGRALAQSRLGTPLEDALEQVADRVGSVDFGWVVMAIRVQREVGGNLADVLLQVAGTIRERAWLRRHVKALSAEGRLSGVILAALPVVIGGYLLLVRPEYVGRLVTTPLGLVMLTAGTVMLGLGMVWMNKIAKVEL